MLHARGALRLAVRRRDPLVGAMMWAHDAQVHMLVLPGQTANSEDHVLTSCGTRGGSREHATCTCWRRRGSLAGRVACYLASVEATAARTAEARAGWPRR